MKFLIATQSHPNKIQTKYNNYLHLPLDANFDAETTIDSLKQKIAEQYPNYAIEQQQLFIDNVKVENNQKLGDITNVDATSNENIVKLELSNSTETNNSDDITIIIRTTNSPSNINDTLQKQAYFLPLNENISANVTVKELKNIIQKQYSKYVATDQRLIAGGTLFASDDDEVFDSKYHLSSSNESLITLIMRNK